LAEEGPLSRKSIARACTLVVLFAAVSTAASAQWVMVGRKVVGKISSLTQPRDAKSPGYDAAAVILDADAGKAYSTAVGLLQKNPSITITKKDDSKLSVAFKQGDWSSELRITDLGDHLCQLLIVSGAGPGESSGTSAVLEAVKRVCDQLGVKYTVE
jgi:hypothetical protein